MGKKIRMILLVACLIIIGFPVMKPCFADIPSGVKDQYRYGDHASGIVLIKERLQKLGYYSSLSNLSDYFGDEFQSVIKRFQKRNSMNADGNLNRAVLERLFSDEALDVNGNLRFGGTDTKKELNTPLVTSSMAETEIVTRSALASGQKEDNKNVERVQDNRPVWFVLAALSCAVLFVLVIIGINRKQRVSGSLKGKTVKNSALHPNTDVNKVRTAAFRHGITVQQELEAKKKREQWLQSRKNEAVHHTNNSLQQHQYAEQRRETLEQQKRELARQRLNALREQQEQIRKRREEEERIRQETEKRKQQTIETVKTHSRRYNQLTNLMKKYYFNENVNTEIDLSYVFTNRYCFDNVKPLDALAYLASNADYLKKSYDAVRSHRGMMQRIKEDSIAETPDYLIQQTGIERTRFLDIEQELCKSIESRIKTDLNVTMRLYYRNGGAHALNTYTFSYNDVDAALRISPVPDIEYTGAREERAKMSPKLRYQIMKRDHFRCVICGASAEDGAKLHVDHIQPVSKGGKTVESNLRTLCDRCNLGKRDQYDPNGLN